MSAHHAHTHTHTHTHTPLELRLYMNFPAFSSALVCVLIVYALISLLYSINIVFL